MTWQPGFFSCSPCAPRACPWAAERCQRGQPHPPFGGLCNPCNGCNFPPRGGPSLRSPCSTYRSRNGEREQGVGQPLPCIHFLHTHIIRYHVISTSNISFHSVSCHIISIISFHSVSCHIISIIIFRILTVKAAACDCHVLSALKGW